MIPREIQVEHWPDRSTYDFPGRPIGKLRLIGLAPMLFSLLFVAFPLQMLRGPLREIFQGRAGPAELIPLVFVSVFVIVALIPFALGLFILAGRTRVVVARDKLVVTQIAGPFRKSRRIKVNQIERLEFRAPDRDSRGRQLPAWIGRLGALAAKLKNGKSCQILIGYPSDWIEPVAEEITGFLKLGGAEVAIQHVEAMPPGPGAPAVEELLRKPDGTLVTLQPRANGLVLTVPAPGLRKGIRALFIFGIVWCAFVAAMVAVVIFSHAPWPVLIFLGAFDLIGVAMLVFALNLARRTATLTCTARSLHVEQTSLFGTKVRQFQPGAIAAVRAGPSGTEINNRPLFELQILPVAGSKFGLLAGREEAELRWIASELRQVLQVPANQPEMTQTGATSS